MRFIYSDPTPTWRLPTPKARQVLSTATSPSGASRPRRHRQKSEKTAMFTLVDETGSGLRYRRLFSSKASRYRCENCSSHIRGIGNVIGRRAEQSDHELIMLRKCRPKAACNRSFRADWNFRFDPAHPIKL